MPIQSNSRIRFMPGARFGRLTVVEELPKLPHSRHRRFLMRCDCGNERSVWGTNLSNGDVRSCGCLARQAAAARSWRHGGTGTPEYHAWCSMRQRCFNPKNPGYHLYGGRGITVCERWRASFTAFLADVGPRPSSIHSIDRIDNDGHYEPGNVRWTTADVQARNQRPETHTARGHRGMANRQAKITDEVVLEIRRRYPGETQKAIAASVGVDQTQVSQIVRRVAWRHI